MRPRRPQDGCRQVQSARHPQRTGQQPDQSLDVCCPESPPAEAATDTVPWGWRPAPSVRCPDAESGMRPGAVSHLCDSMAASCSVGPHISPARHMPRCRFESPSALAGSCWHRACCTGRVPTQTFQRHMTAPSSLVAVGHQWPKNMQLPQRRLQRASRPVGTRVRAADTCSTGRMWSMWEQQHWEREAGASPLCLCLLCGNDWCLGGHKALSKLTFLLCVEEMYCSQLTPSWLMVIAYQEFSLQALRQSGTTLGWRKIRAGLLCFQKPGVQDSLCRSQTANE